MKPFMTVALLIAMGATITGLMRTVHDAITASPYIAAVCGTDPAIADRYEARNDVAVSYRPNF